MKARSTSLSDEETRQALDDDDTRTDGTALYEELPSGRLLKIPAGYLTQRMISARLGLPDQEIRRYVQRGVLKSTMLNSQGWALYKEEDVEGLARFKKKEDDKKAGFRVRVPRMGPATAETKMVYSVDEGLSVFALLDAGTPIHQIFQKTRIHPSVIHTIAKDYELFTKSILIPREMIDKMNELSLEGNFPISSADDVLGVMRLAAEGRQCPDCQKRAHAQRCERCIRRTLIKSMERDAKLRKLLPADDPNLTSLDEGEEDEGEDTVSRRAGTRTDE